MIFSSILFLFYFLPLVISGYYLLCFSRKLQNYFLFFASIFFYAWGNIKSTFILLFSILINYIFGLMVTYCKSKKHLLRYLLTLMCATNLGILFIYKYSGFVVRNINDFTQKNYIVPQLALPLGISFFTFQAISYVIDVSRGTARVQKNPFYLGLYIALFPQLIAGPIVKYAAIEKQILFRKNTLRKFSVGCCRFLTGLGKKIIIANTMAIVADKIYQLIPLYTISVSLAWLGSIAYSLQIFFDFSAYSDMAIGLGLIFGFEFDENFNYPYMSASVTEFWRRWHISLTTWFKDYVYFPLGGSRVKNNDIMVRNMLIVWLLTGIWHGAEWTFLFWGLYHFFIILLEKVFRNPHKKNHSIVNHIYTLLMINWGWVLFRSSNLSIALSLFQTMFGIKYKGIFCDYTILFLKEYGIFLIFGIIFSTPVAKRCNRLLVENRFGIAGFFMNVSYLFCIICIFFVCVTYLVKGSYNPFIYFNF
ncbi:MBOAT family O-acyltransferase [Anaeromicropila populeti]|uniref:Alginate O-acetyltransferase complex protein AlgI n=1 Tax=Anaeromicropila populeti TaxID=37658 RepID=A0A1I6JBU6_9FIRM|nr:MBOAT family O-acyltransferase [Anaeromicropila populeti]SFR76465.1 hypothetical protein SAMN05661086_01543 [Anaeromicropila populeti]